MSNTWKRILSLLLAVVMMLSLGVTGFAEDAEEGEASLIWEEGPEEGPEEDPLEPDSYELSPDSLNVPKLGLDEEEDAFADGQGRIALVGEPEEEDTVDLNEVVRVSVFLEDPATLAAGYSARSVNAPAAVSYRNGLRAQQAEMTARIEGVIGHPLKVHWNLTLAANAIATELSLGEMTKVEAIPGVRSVQRENRYYAQEDEPAQPETAHTSENMVGAAAAWNAGYTGAGSRIAIIDTGIDTEHQSFDADAFNYAIAETGKDVELMTDIPGGLNGSGVRISDKIPFAYNYVDEGGYYSNLIYDSKPDVFIRCGPNPGLMRPLSFQEDESLFHPNYGNVLVADLSGINGQFDNQWLILQILLTDGSGNTQLQTLQNLFFTVNPLSIEEYAAERLEHEVIPNPFTDEVRIKSAQPLDGVARVQLYDVLGRRVYDATENGHAVNEFIIDGSALKPGIYFYRINTKNDMMQGKIVKD